MAIGFHDEKALRDYLDMIRGIFRLEDDGDIVTAVEYMCDDKGLNDQAKVTAIRMVVKDL